MVFWGYMVFPDIGPYWSVVNAIYTYAFNISITFSIMKKKIVFNRFLIKNKIEREIFSYLWCFQVYFGESFNFGNRN